MEENRAIMVTISADEYFELRSRSQTNLYLTEKLANLQNDINILRNEVHQLKTRVDKEV